MPTLSCPWASDVLVPLPSALPHSAPPPSGCGSHSPAQGTASAHHLFQQGEDDLRGSDYLGPGGWFRTPGGISLANAGGSPRASCLPLPTLHIFWQVGRSETQRAAGPQGALEESGGDEKCIQLPEDPSRG